jgi:hypothetical protein
MFVRTIGWVCLLGLASVALCAEPDKPAPVPANPADLREQVAHWVENLDSDRRAVRVQAERELLDLGPKILPLLPAQELLSSAAVRASVFKIRVVLERRQASESVEASRVSLKTTAPIAEILHAIAEQTGNQFDLSRLPDELAKQKLAVDWDKATYWSALDDLTTRAKLAYVFDAGRNALGLRKRASDDDRELAVHHDGAFRVAIDSAELRPIFGKPAEKLLRVRLNVASEPRMRPLFLKYAARDIKARTPQGRDLPAANPDAQYDLPLGEGGRFLRGSVDFVVPADAALEQISLRGKLLMQTAAGSEHIRFTNLPRAEGVARRRGGVTVTLQRVSYKQAAEPSSKEASEQDVSLQVAVVYDTGGPAFESHRTWIFHNEVWLENAEGKQLPPNGGYTTELQGDGIVSVSYRFLNVRGRLNDCSFVYVAPTLIIDAPVEFDFPTLPVGRVMK